MALPQRDSLLRLRCDLCKSAMRFVQVCDDEEEVKNYSKKSEMHFLRTGLLENVYNLCTAVALQVQYRAAGTQLKAKTGDLRLRSSGEVKRRTSEEVKKSCNEDECLRLESLVFCLAKRLARIN